MRILIILMLGLTGCATILQPGPDRIKVNSSPEGARITVDGDVVGHTPMVIPLKHDAEGVFVLDLAGYDSVTVDRDKVMSGWVIGNILLGGVIGTGVDLITHNQGHYQETPIFAELHKKSTTTSAR